MILFLISYIYIYHIILYDITTKYTCIVFYCENFVLCCIIVYHNIPYHVILDCAIQYQMLIRYLIF